MAAINLGDNLLFQGDSASTTYTSVNTLFNNILPNVYIVAGLIIFVMIVVGGFTIIANGGNQDKVAEGGKIITSAIIGFVVLFASYWIIQLIQVLTGIQILSGNPL